MLEVGHRAGEQTIFVALVIQIWLAGAKQQTSSLDAHYCLPQVPQRLED